MAVDRSGWIVLRVLEVKRTLRSVGTMDGDRTTVVTTKTSQYRAILDLQANMGLQVSGLLMLFRRTLYRSTRLFSKVPDIIRQIRHIISHVK